jgi:uncharacterized integral membrane protein
MPWRLVVFIVIFAVFLIFIALNLGDDYKCNINFGFKKFQDVPVFITIFTSFALGLFCTLPIALRYRKPHREPVIIKEKKQDKKPVKEDTETVSRNGSPDGASHLD